MTAAPWLSQLGFSKVPFAHVDLSVPRLYEEAIRRAEATLAADGPIIAHTGPHTGRSANDRFIVRDATTEKLVDWGTTNKAISPAHAARLRAKVLAHLSGRGEVFVQHCSVGADPQQRIGVHVVNERAWHNLFAKNMFLGPSATPVTETFTVLHAPGCKADPATDGTRTATFIVVDLTNKTIIIGGTEYAGEIKKSVFSVMNFLLPQREVMSMHCSANVGATGDVALFFGLSGTGKTTLSADPERALVGDDEHGWSASGVFNIEGGCYAKVIKLSAEAEPEIYATTRRFGTVLENVVFDAETRELDLDSDKLTENTRASYTLDKIPNTVPSGQAALPRNVVFLTCDAFGVLPPVSRLTPEQAMYHFLSGYTAKVAGTEIGVTEPKATFSTCFGAPFMPLHPGVYAKLLGERMAHAGAKAWLINTGWSGGGFGVGKRMKISHTRAMVRAVLSGALDGVETRRDAVFGLEVPVAIDGIPPEVLRPRDTWADKGAYDAQQTKLSQMFRDNFEQYRSGVSKEIAAAAPK
ncbi:MAG: phosphoenolpyruvate carboxykinase (ATP) [Polyangia bacterium]